MIIEKLEIISFGKFKNKIIDFSSGLNVIYGDNESGKSTVISFILAMLYGFGDNRGKVLSLREKYTPWSGGMCEGKLFLRTDEGEKIVIYRKAGNAKKYDTFRIYSYDTGDDILRSVEDFVGVNSDTFMKTLCIKQLSSALQGSNDEIVQKLSNTLSGGDENISYEKAQKLLEAVRREIQPQRGSGGALSDIKQKITSLEQRKASDDSVKTELSSLRALLPALQKEAAELEKQLKQLSEKDYAASIARLDGRIEELRRHFDKSFTTFKGFKIFSAALSAISVITIFVNFKYAAILLVLSAILILLSFTGKKFLVKDSICSLTEEKEKLETEKSAHDMEISEYSKKLQDLKEKIYSLKMREKTLSFSLSDKDEDSASLYKKRLILEKRLNAAVLASEALKMAHDKMQKNFTPSLNEKASRYFSRICGGKYTRIFCDEQFGIQVESDIPRESGFFSGGTVDQLYLSVRLALIDMLFKDKSCTLILDQPFLQYDDVRKKSTVELLESLSDNRQILLFTGDKTLNSAKKPTEILT